MQLNQPHLNHWWQPQLNQPQLHHANDAALQQVILQPGATHAQSVTVVFKLWRFVHLLAKAAGFVPQVPLPDQVPPAGTAEAFQQFFTELPTNAAGLRRLSSVYGADHSGVCAREASDAPLEDLNLHVYHSLDPAAAEAFTNLDVGFIIFNERTLGLARTTSDEVCCRARRGG